MINSIINKANHYVGYLEKKNNNNLSSFTANAGYNNYTIFAETYKNITGVNLQAQPWCAMFISVIFYETFGKTQGKELLINYFHSCITGSNNFKNKNQFYKSNPKIGDIIFFYDASNVIGHVGIVYNVDNTYVYTIEGNTSSVSGVVANGGCVAKKSYLKNYKKIAGYGRPKYINLEEEKLMNELKEQINKLENTINSLQIKINELNQQINSSKELIYNWTTACPDWSQPYVQKALDLGYIKGDLQGQLNLTDTKIWCLVVMLRAKGIME